jgi:hypothetical protein
VPGFREGSPVFGVLATGCFLAAFAEYCFGACPHPFGPAGLTLLGLASLATHAVWSWLWRRTS